MAYSILCCCPEYLSLGGDNQKVLIINTTLLTTTSSQIFWTRAQQAINYLLNISLIQMPIEIICSIVHTCILFPFR